MLQRIRCGFIAAVASAGVFGVTLSQSAVSAASASSVVHVPCSVGGPHGLIAAVKAANQAGGGTLDLAGRCTYSLTARDNDTDGGNGLPVLTGQITIVGQAGTTITRAGAAATPDFRILEVAEGAEVTLSQVTIAGGKLLGDSFQGGAIDNEGTITGLTNDTLRDNSAAFGGAVFNNGTIIDFNDDRIAGNKAGNGGGLANLGRITNFAGDTVSGNRAGIGGGITNGGAIISLRHSLISDNHLSGDGAGGGIANSYGLLNMTNDVVRGNTATAGPLASGGGIDNSGRLTLTDSVVKDNVARGVGGGLRNEEQADARFVFVVKATTVAANTVTSAKGPATGGGIYNGGAMTVADSRVHENRATARSGRAVAAGIYNAHSLTVAGTAISANLVTDRGGEAEGGGLYVDEGSTKTALKHTTVTGNRAIGAHPHGGGILFAGGSPVALLKSPVTGNAPENCFPAGPIKGCT